MSEEEVISDDYRSDDSVQLDSKYPELDLESLHISGLSVRSDASKKRVDDIWSELIAISAKLKKESALLQEKRLAVEFKEEEVKQRVLQLDDLSAQLFEKEKSLVELRQNIIGERNGVETRYRDMVSVEVLETESRYKSLLGEKVKENERLSENFAQIRSSYEEAKRKECSLRTENDRLVSRCRALQSRLDNMSRLKKKSSPSSVSVATNTCHATGRQSTVVKSTDAQTNVDRLVLKLLAWIEEECLVKSRDDNLSEISLAKIKEASEQVMEYLHENLKSNCPIETLRLIYWCVYFHRHANIDSVLPMSARKKLYTRLCNEISDMSSSDCTISRGTEPNLEQEILMGLLVLVFSKQTDQLVPVFRRLKEALLLDQARNFFVYYRGLFVLRRFMSSKNLIEVNFAADILLTITSDSDPSVITAINGQLTDDILCFIKKRNTDYPVVEKLMVILQRMSRHSSIERALQKHQMVPVLSSMMLDANSNSAFLALAIRSVLSSIGATVPALK